jgi:hypothetical protein
MACCHDDNPQAGQGHPLPKKENDEAHSLVKLGLMNDMRYSMLCHVLCSVLE